MAYIVLDRYDNPWGPFEDANKAAEWARTKFPEYGQRQWPVPGKGWDVVALRDPSE